MHDVTLHADGLGFPEGPVWLDDGSLVVVEIAVGRVSRLAPSGRRTTLATTGGGPNGAAIGPDGALYVCNNGGFEWQRIDGQLLPGHQAHDYETGRIERIELDSGRVERLYSACDGRRLSGPNDIVFDAHGGFWFTDLGKSRAHDRDQGGVYYATPDGRHIRAAVYPLDGPNGIGLSPDGRTLYVAMTVHRQILAFDVVSPGVVEASPLPPLPGRVVTSFPGRVLPDSMAVLESGGIAQATLVGEPGIATVDVPSGAYQMSRFDDLFTTNIAFGGGDRCTAAITLSATGRVVTTRWPEPGLALAFGA